MNVTLPEGHEILSTKDESVRLFSNYFLDKFSRVYWFVPLIFFVPVVLYFFYESYQLLTFSKSLLLFFGGLGVWTIVEYLFHRYIFHYVPKSQLGKKIHFMIHGVHHAYPNDSLRLVMPPILSIPLATAFYFAFYYTAGVYSAGLFSGFILGYLMYDMMHFATHHAHFMKASWFLKIKHHHMRHHFQDPDNGFGVSSALWDRIFKTEFKQS